MRKLTKYSIYLAGLICVLYSVIIIVPVGWMGLSSTKKSLEIFRGPWILPESVQWQNYTDAWIKVGIGHNFVNSVIITTISVSLILMLSAMATFAITRLDFHINRLVLYLFIGGLFLPKALMLSPLFILLNNLGLIDSYLGLVPVYIAYSFPFTIFLLTPFFNNIPVALEEAAIIDGASLYELFWKIAIPLAKPGLIIAGLFNVFGIWNEYVFAYTIIFSDNLRTLPLGLSNLLLTQYYQTNWGVLFAGLVMAVLPVFIIYVFFQRWLTGGIMTGALKE